MFCSEAQYPFETLCRAQYFGARMYFTVVLVNAGKYAKDELESSKYFAFLIIV